MCYTSSLVFVVDRFNRDQTASHPDESFNAGLTCVTLDFVQLHVHVFFAAAVVVVASCSSDVVNKLRLSL